MRPVLLAVLAFFVLIAPELGRMIDFHSFETFDPNGPGLGNLFGQISPFEALGIWPSGDFRLAPGDGAVPAVAYYLGAAFALVLLVHGTIRCWRRRETAILAGLTAAALVYVVARVDGTPYTAAKAIEIATPLTLLAILLPLTARASRPLAGGAVEGPTPEEALATGGGGGSPAATGPAGGRLALALFVLAAGACSVLALANAPIGPTSYSPNLTELRPLVADGSTLVLASRELLEDQHGTPYIAWELRGGRVCIEAEGELGGRPPHGVRFVVAEGGTAAPPYPGLRIRRIAPPYVLWEATGQVAPRSSCQLVAVRQARQGPARG